VRGVGANNERWAEVGMAGMTRRPGTEARRGGGAATELWEHGEGECTVRERSRMCVLVFWGLGFQALFLVAVSWSQKITPYFFGDLTCCQQMLLWPPKKRPIFYSDLM
jgi:hypothetical protein